MSYRIIPTRGYYEVYINGRFYCSADNIAEAEKEIESYRMEMGI
jgi:hypothetical protein